VRAKRTSRPVEVGRGEDTRRRLIDAAIDVFGLRSFEGATTRALAEAAGTNLAAIPYHFGSKQGLYLAVAESISEALRSRLGPKVEHIAVALAGGALRSDDALALLHELLDAFATFIVGSSEVERWARIAVREQLNPSPAFDLIYTRMLNPMLSTLVALLGRAAGRTIDPQALKIVAVTLFGQVLVFRVARATVMRHLQWERVGEVELAAVREAVHANIDAIVGRLRRGIP
jgi:AcrR family transcriptional regulator